MKIPEDREELCRAWLGGNVLWNCT